ncbi:MAG: peptidylprolyl isomerase [Candidatus Wallbacteria bacterium]
MNQGSIFFSKNNIIVKVVIWSVVAAFVLSIFIFAGTFHLNLQNEKANEAASLKKKSLEDDKNKLLMTAGSGTKENEFTVTFGDFYDYFNRMNDNFKKMATKVQREGLIDQVLMSKILEEKMRTIVVKPADYEEALEKYAANFGKTKAEFVEYLLKGYKTREGIEEALRAEIQQRKLAEQVAKPRDVNENLLKEYYEKHKDEFKSMGKLPGATAETMIQKEFAEVKDEIKGKLAVNVTDEEIKKFYEDHKARFKNASKINLAHIFIKADAPSVKNTITPKEDELKAYFESNKTNYKTIRNIELKSISKSLDDEKLLAEIKVGDSEAVEFYNRNKDKFKSRASVNIKNILIETKNAAKMEAMKPSEDELKSFYNETAEVRASHILVASDTLAAELKKKLNEGAKFEDLAREHSTDPGSKANGGDLNFFGRGMMVKEFEETAFKLKINEISEPVKSQFGYHIIKVTDQRKAYAKPYEDVTGEVRAAYIEKKLEENAKKLAEQISDRCKKGENFADLAKQYSDSPSKSNGGVLGVIYNDNKEIENIDKLTGEITFNGHIVPQILSKAFSPEFKENTASEAIKTALGYNVIMVSDRVESKDRPFDACKTDVINDLKKQRAEQLVVEKMDKIRERIKGGVNFDQIAAEESTGSQAKNGGAIGVIYTGEAPANFDKSKMVGEILSKPNEEIPAEVMDAVKSLMIKNDVTKVIKLPGRLVILKAEAINEPTFKKFEDVKQQVTDAYITKKTEELIRKKMDEALIELKKGEKFEAVCQKYSEGFSKANGGVLGDFVKGEQVKDPKMLESLKGEILMPWGMMDPAIDEVIFDIEAGKNSDVLKSNLGFHIFKVNTIDENNYKSLDEVKDKIKNTITKGLYVSDEEIKQYYEQHKSEYSTSEKVKVKIITVKTKAEAEKIHTEITKGGKDFSAAAREYSIDQTTKDSGGVLPEFTRGQVNKELETAAFSLPVGSVSSVFEAQLGFNIIQVTDKIPAKVSSLEEKRGSIKEILLAPKRTEVIEDYVNEIKNTLKIKKVKENYHLLTKYDATSSLD